jgi:two-component system, OmpR family, response regulator QseB
VRVLIVDDNAMNRRVIKHMLDTSGVIMAEADDGETGLELFDVEAFDLVLMDLRMPKMDGLTAIRHIRARKDDKAKAPIIVVTADNARDIRERCLAAGADDVLLKPVAMQALFDAMGRVMARSGGAAAMLG